MPDENTVLIFDAMPATPGGDARPMQARGVAEKLQSAVEVGVEQLEQNFGAFLANLGRILGKAESMAGTYQVDRVEIEALVSADGKVGLAGSSVGLSGKSSVKLVLVRGGNGGKG